MLFATRGISILRPKSWEPHILKKAVTDGVAEHQGPAAKIPRCSERSSASCGVLLYDGGEAISIRYRSVIFDGPNFLSSLQFLQDPERKRTRSVFWTYVSVFRIPIVLRFFKKFKIF